MMSCETFIGRFCRSQPERPRIGVIFSVLDLTRFLEILAETYSLRTVLRRSALKVFSAA